MSDPSVSKIDQLAIAHDYVSSGGEYGDLSAYISKKDGAIVHGSSSVTGIECPVPDIEESDEWVPVPDKFELNLGRNLVFRFADRLASENAEEIRVIFKRRGAYSRFKSLLERIGKLQDWYDFEESETIKALRDWCECSGVSIEG